ncbi:helix-turn-helix domain-containing protein [Owenweeksia hongkongensis]|uniref:AlbA family DNA-binding domain-containing protein n=1 Tax=Owenweeksia hongkongensis TaxID=253245 RepID=UPI003A91B0C1
MNPHPYPFKKSIQELTFADLEEYFSQKRRENQHLEFKSGEVTIDKILKEVGAFLNAEGGVLIIGAPRELERPHDTGVCIGELTRSSFESVETVKTYLSNDIIPPPPRLEIVQLQDATRNVFVIDIPTSPAAPHQVLRNGKYYFRDGDMSRPARHREVEKMFANRQNGNLQVQLKLDKEIDDLSMAISIENLSSKTAKNIGYKVQCLPVRQMERLVVEKHFDKTLNQHQSWKDKVSIPYSSERIYIQVDTFGENLITKTKAAFVAIAKTRTELLATYYSEEINAPSPVVFFETNKYLLV